MSFNVADVAWLAGLLEGEGSFNNAHKGYPRVQMTSTDRDVVERSAVLVGANLLGPYANGGHGSKPIYRWYVNGRRAVDLMWQLLPFMGERRRAQIEQAL